VAFLIMPLFAFANAGVSLNGIGWSSFTAPIPLGVAAGLLVGKQVGVFSFAWAAIRLGLAGMPEGANWKALYGVSLLCGIGFTMSLFIGSLAFAPGTIEESMDERLGILTGSVLSGVLGYLVLRSALKKKPSD
jgi:NhaA family Na+:H+ antiporter